MSAKKELSSTLRNLKFMQRALPKSKREDAKEADLVEQPKVDDGFGATLVRKCKVVMEGNPHPGAIAGRMSFQGFNPAIDKLNQESTECSRPQASFSVPERQNGESSTRTNFGTHGEDGNLKVSNATEMDHKRKTPEKEPEISPTQEGDGQLSLENSKRDCQKPKREKLDWNALRREKPKVKRG